MKIRTDFVTNSSSSSFVLEIGMKTTDGQACSVLIDPFEGEGWGEVSLNCEPEDIAKAESLKELFKLLGTVNISEGSETGSAFENKASILVKDLGDIATIELRTIWQAWGEGSSCFKWNLESYAPGLKQLAHSVLSTEGEEKEKAKKALQEYLSNFSGYIGEGREFSPEDLGKGVKGEIVWTKSAKTIEEFAQQLVDEDLPNDDYAEVTTEIDMKTGKITYKAQYIPDGEYVPYETLVDPDKYSKSNVFASNHPQEHEIAKRVISELSEDELEHVFEVFECEAENELPSMFYDEMLGDYTYDFNYMAPGTPEYAAQYEEDLRFCVSDVLESDIDDDEDDDE